MKNEIDHQPKNLSEAVYLMRKMVKDTFDFMMMALYGQGPWRIAPGSKIRPVPQSIWERWSPERQLQHFEQVLLGEDTNRKGVQNPRPHLGMGILAQLSAEEKKQARSDHKEALKVYNLNEKKRTPIEIKRNWSSSTQYLFKCKEEAKSKSIFCSPPCQSKLQLLPRSTINKI